MNFGITMFVTDETIRPDELAIETELRGFDSLFFPEHTHIPISRESAYPLGGELPREYMRTMDPFVAITAAVTATSSIRVGTGMCLVAQRDPIITAKAVATIDQLSRGRMIFGIGAGWNLEEMRNHGVDPDVRWTAMRERIQAMKRIWTDDVAQYSGQTLQLDPSWCWPKPLQKPHPPVLLGGSGPHTFQRVLAYADEWGPTYFHSSSGEMGRGSLIEQVRELRTEAERVGRARIPVTVFGAPADQRVLDELAAGGVDRVVFWLPCAERDEALLLLDRHMAFQA